MPRFWEIAPVKSKKPELFDKGKRQRKHTVDALWLRPLRKKRDRTSALHGLR